MDNSETIKNWIALLLVILLAYFLRVLPYLTYQWPLDIDSIKEFQQVLYIQQTHQLNWGDPFGAFPITHLIVYFFSLTGVNLLFAHLFILPLVSSLGILFFYLFLRSYIEEKYAILASFFLAAFGPNIFWGFLAVRETVGLFLFPLIIYLFDREMTKGSLWNKILLLSVVVCMVATHHWTTFLLIVTLLCLTFLYKDKWKSIILISCFAVFALIYWALAFPLVLSLLEKAISTFAFQLGIVLCVILCVLLAIAFTNIKTNISKLILKIQTGIFKMRDEHQKFIIPFLIVLFFLAIFIFDKITVFEYPPQTYLSLFLPFIFASAGVLPAIKTRNYLISDFILIILVYLILILAIFVSAGDPFRIFEFLIYPAAIFCAFGFCYLSNSIGNKWICTLMVLILIFSGILIYPPTFVFHSDLNGTPFYDVRSDLRYVPEEGFCMMEFGNGKNLNILSNLHIFNGLKETFYPPGNLNVVLLSNSDYKILENAEKIHRQVFDIDWEVENPELFLNRILGMDKIYSNDWGGLYKSSNDTFPSDSGLVKVS